MINIDRFDAFFSRTGYRFLPILVLGLLLLASCADESPTLQPVGSNQVILAFGDSLTYGTGAGRDESYPAVLSQLSDRKVINSGVPGEVSSAGRMRLAQVLAQYQPALVLLCHGGNDILRRQSPTQTAENLTAMISAIRASGAEVVLIGVPEYGLLLSDAPFYAAVAEATATPLVDEALSTVLQRPALKSDQIHPNAEGYRQLAEAIFAKLKRSGAL